MRRTPKRTVSSRHNGEKELMALLDEDKATAKPGKKRWILIAGGACIVCAAVALVLLLSNGRQAASETVYREYTVMRGNIIVGQNESSSISLS